MLETLGFIAFLLAIVFVVMGPKPASKDEKKSDSDSDSDSAGK